MGFGEIGASIFFSLVIFMSSVWTFFAWGMGIVNYQEQHTERMGKFASFCWYALFAVHIIALYLLWFKATTGLSVIFVLAWCHCFFYAFFAQNISTR